jgi:uncharacterized protein (DUF433 family)
MAETTQVGINYIVKSPGLLGGRARIDGRRIGVSDVVNLHLRLSIPVEDIAASYRLTLAQIYAALAYYYDHQEEIDSYLDEEYRIGEQHASDDIIAQKRAELEAKHPDMARRIRASHPKD